MTDAEKIAEFIRKHGVTLCPPAYAMGCVFPTRNVIVVDFGVRRSGGAENRQESPA